MHELDYILCADELLAIFLTHTDDNFHLTMDGFIEMQMLFEEVPLDDRKYVFIEFLHQLDENGIPYDKEQFLEDE